MICKIGAIVKRPLVLRDAITLKSNLQQWQILDKILGSGAGQGGGRGCFIAAAIPLAMLY